MKYLIARKLFATSLRGFYSNVTADGLDKLPDNKSVLFIANHCNAFIDPLLLASRMNRRVTFTAKNTLAKNPLLNLVLKSFSVELFSRRMDRNNDISGRACNSATLQRLQKKLSNRGAVFIFPEGQSHCDSTLRRFKTGAAKLALDYAHSCSTLDSDNDLLIVPLGLHYGDKSVFRSSAHIQVGEPLSLREWLEQNPQANAGALTKKFKLMVEDALAVQKQLVRKQRLSVQPPQLVSRASSRYRKYEQRILGVPLGMFGWLLNALPFAITSVLVNLLSSDHDHPASAAVVVSPPVFFLVHVAQLIAVGFVGSAFLALLYLLLLVPSTLFALAVFDALFRVGEASLALQT